MALVVTELAARYTADTTEFKAGAQSVQAELRATQEQAQSAATQMDAYWRQVGQTSGAQAGVERLSGTVQGLQRQMQVLGEQHPNIRFTDNGEAVAQQLTNLQTRLQELSGKPYSVELRANTALIKEDLARVQAQIKEIQSQSISLNTGSATQEVEGLGGVLGHLSGVALPLVGLTAVEAFKQAADAAIEWQTTLTELQNNTGVTTTQLSEMADAIRSVQSASNVSSASLTEAEMHITNFGFHGAEATDVLDEAMKSASSTGGNTAKTAELLANAMHEYGNATYTATQAVDVLHIAAQRGNATFEQFAEASGQAVGVAANLHVPLEQVTAAISALTQHGYSADEATTQMTAAMTHLINPSKEAQTVLANLSKTTGVDLVSDFSASGLASKGLTGVLDDLHSAFTRMGYSEEQATQATMQLLNAQRGGLGVATLLGTGARDYRDTLAAMAATMSGQTTPTQDAFNRSTQTTGYQLGILGNNLDIAKTRLGAFTAQAQPVTDALNAVNAMLQNSNVGWKAIETEPEKYAEGLDAYRAFVRGLPAGELIDALLPKPADLEKRAQEARAAAAQGLAEIRADVLHHSQDEHEEIQAAGVQIVADVNATWHAAQQAQYDQMSAMNNEADVLAMANADEVAAPGKKIVDGVIANWQAAQDTQRDQMNAMNDEASALAMANADAVYDPLAANVGRMGTIGDAASTAYMSQLAGGFASGMPAVNAYVKALADAHDISGLMAILGKNDAVAFITNMKMELAAGMEQVAAKMQDSMDGADNAATAALNKRAAALRSSAISFGQQMGALPQTLAQAEQEAADKAAKAAKAAADAAARKETAAERAAAAAAKRAEAAQRHAEAQAKAAETAARQEVASTETIIRALEQAAQQTDVSSKGIGQSLVTLMGVLKAKVPPEMGFIRDSITQTLQEASSAAPPSIQALHDRVVGWLHQLREHGGSEVALFAQAALEQLSDFSTGAQTKVEQATAKMDAALVKAHQSAVEGLGKLGELLTDPKANVGDVTVAMLDAQKAAVDAKLPALAQTYQQYLDQISNGTTVNLGQVRQTVLSQLQAMQTGSDPVMAAWAGAMIAKMDEVAQKAQQDAQQVFEAQAQQRDALLQTQRSLADSLGTVGSDLIGGASDPAAVVDMLKLVQDASKTGAADLAGTFTQIIATVNNGGKLLTEQTLNTVRAFLQELSQSADAETAMMARKVLANLDKMQADATKQAQQAAQQAAQSMEQAGQGMVQGLAKAAQDMQTPGKTLTDVLVDLMPIMQQATAAGMPQVAATIEQYLDQARAGGTVSIQGLHDALVRMLQDAQQSGNQSVALFAQQAIEQLNQVAQQAEATASLQAYQQAQQDAQAAAQRASEAYTRQQKVLQDLQKQLQAAQKAQQDFTHAPLQGEHAANEAQFQNQQQQNQLQLQITRLQFEGAPRAQIEALTHQLDTVRQQGEILRLQTSTTFDPLHHAIEQAVNDTKELTYQDAINGAVAQEKAVDALQQKIAEQTRVVDQAQAAQQRAQAAAQAASQAYQEQQQALQRLQQAQQQSLLQMAQMAQAMQATGTQAQTTGAQVQAGLGQQATTGVQNLNTAVTTGVGQVLPAYTQMFAPTNDGSIFHLLFDHSEGFFTKVDQAITTAMDYTRLEVWLAQFTMLKELVTTQMGRIRGEAANGGRQVGNALGSGIREGIGEEVAGIAQAAAEAVTQAIEAARRAADAHSPSEESRKKVGAPIGQGIARGIRDTAMESAAAARQNVQGALAAGAAAVGAGPGVGGAGGFGGALTVNNYLNAQLSMKDLTDPAFWDGPIGRAISIMLQRRGAMRQPNGAPA